jgi:hypothetical protein
MESLANDRLIDRLVDEFDIAIGDNYDLCNALAFATMDRVEHYLYCKDGGELDYDYIYDHIEQAFFNSDSSCFDIRELAKKAFPKLDI